MAAQSQYEQLARQLSAIGAVKRGLARVLPNDCPPGSIAVLNLLDLHGEMRMSRMAELLAVDMSVTSRHVAHVADRGWLDRSPDPSDRRSRILRLTPEGKLLLTELSERYVRTLGHYMENWSDEEVDQLISLLGRLREDFGDCRSIPGRLTDEPAPVPSDQPTARTSL
ncbi:MarR family transcriptional regulator [Streptomyces albidoflavus]|uniref:MarR family winged helix-turn-helix transcriptional regulator n=1 Tax=Streptomyces albidoflavus TaxID=1886 RepID=UPI0033CF47AA